MSKPQPIDAAEASPEVRAVFDDIKALRNVEDVNNFWKYLARDPVSLKRTWESVKQVMAPGALVMLTPVVVGFFSSNCSASSAGEPRRSPRMRQAS